MKNIILNKYYKKLRKNVFPNLSIDEFMEVFKKFKKLKFDYRLLTICNFIEKIKIPRIEIPILRFLSMCLDMIRWFIYDILFAIINGKIFALLLFDYNRYVQLIKNPVTILSDDCWGVMHIINCF